MKEEIVVQQESFAKRLIEALKQRLSRTIALDYQRIVKTNDTKKAAIIVREEGCPVGKTIYIDDFFDRYNDGTDIDTIAEEVVKICEVKSCIEVADGEELSRQMKDFEYLLNGHIVVKLINRDKSKQYLEGKAYLSYLDLAIVFNMILMTDDGEMATSAIPLEATESWGVSLEEALPKVLSSMEKGFPLKRATMYEFMVELLKNRLGCIEEHTLDKLEATSQMYIQTNEQSVNGALTAQ